MVSYQLAQTEADLQSEDGLSNYSAIKASAIARAKAEFWLTAAIPAEAAMADVVKYYLADVAASYLIDTAIDWYQSRTVRRQVEEQETLEFYDRVESLRGLQQRLQARIAAAGARIRAIAFGADIGDIAGLPLAQAQADSSAKVTLDPWQWARYLYGDYVSINEGVDPQELVIDRP